ncbi:MAG TPA: hypothetical protein VMT32_17015 [Bryobacteraceae bacterium]|nr:hypothetical protein [Bryobacteraceae bacterium]
MTHDLTPGSDTKRPRDPEDRKIDQQDENEKREKALDKTIADSFPTSDPPSTIPDPGSEDSLERTA